MSDFLLEQLGLSRDDFYQVEGPVNLVRLMQVPDRIDASESEVPTIHSWFAADAAKEEDC